VSAGEDKLLKIWDYEQGTCNWIGAGHSNTINRVKIAPNQEFIVSVGNDGSIYFWETPLEIRLSKADKYKP
jgi:WD40 repeat protein